MRIVSNSANSGEQWQRVATRVATIRHYSRLFAIIRTIRDYSQYSLFGTIRYSLFGFSRHPVLPYVSGVSERVLRHGKGIKVGYKPFNVLRTCFPRPKDKPSALQCRGLFVLFTRSVTLIAISFTMDRLTEPWKQDFYFFLIFLLTLYTALIYNTTLVRLLTQFTTIIQLQITNNYRDNYLQR